MGTKVWEFGRRYLMKCIAENARLQHAVNAHMANTVPVADEDARVFARVGMDSKVLALLHNWDQVTVNCDM